MSYESKKLGSTTQPERPIYFHAAWERAIHRFCRVYEETKGLQRGSTPLKAIQDFHSQWYQNKGYRLRANEVVECPICKHDYEESLATGEVFPQKCPDSVRDRARNYGIRLGGGAKVSQSPSRA